MKMITMKFIYTPNETPQYTQELVVAAVLLIIQNTSSFTRS